MSDLASDAGPVEDLESFRLRARAWITAIRWPIASAARRRERTVCRASSMVAMSNSLFTVDGSRK